MFDCRVCGHALNNRRFMAREMMFGWRDQFEYFECAACGCLQIARIPPDLSRYYPENYHSFRAESLLQSPLKRYLKRRRIQHALGRRSLPGWLLGRLFGPPPLADWVRRTGIGCADAILDVGSGGGHLLLELHNAGFRALAGADPYLERDIDYGNGVVVAKRTLPEQDGAFDLIMLHHAFEHMPDPLATLQQIHRLLKPGRCALLRIPVAGCYAWRTYGANWVQLDAPRHLLLHTEKSIRLLTGKAGLALQEIVYDSTGLQFWGSELYQRDIPLIEDAGPATFSRREMRLFQARARGLNTRGDGDQAAFYLRKI